MPVKYEYIVYGHDFIAVGGPETQDWLNEMGEKGWILSALNTEFAFAIFYREIAINKKLREIQLKGDIENGSSETTESIPGEGI